MPPTLLSIENFVLRWHQHAPDYDSWLNSAHSLLEDHYGTYEYPDGVRASCVIYGEIPRSRSRQKVATGREVYVGTMYAYTPGFVLFLPAEWGRYYVGLVYCQSHHTRRYVTKPIIDPIHRSITIDIGPFSTHQHPDISYKLREDEQRTELRLYAERIKKMQVFLDKWTIEKFE